jgi:hypothetical protein
VFKDPAEGGRNLGEDTLKEREKKLPWLQSYEGIEI